MPARPGFNKRMKEQARREKQRAKFEKKVQRKAEKSEGIPLGENVIPDELDFPVHSVTEDPSSEPA